MGPIFIEWLTKFSNKNSIKDLFICPVLNGGFADNKMAKVNDWRAFVLTSTFTHRFLQGEDDDL